MQPATAPWTAPFLVGAQAAPLLPVIILITEWGLGAVTANTSQVSNLDPGMFTVTVTMTTIVR